MRAVLAVDHGVGRVAIALDVVGRVVARRARRRRAQRPGDQALGSVIKRLVAWTLRTPPARPAPDDAPYNIERYRNPANAVIDTENCPKGNDASMVPVTDE